MSKNWMTKTRFFLIFVVNIIIGFIALSLVSQWNMIIRQFNNHYILFSLLAIIAVIIPMILLWKTKEWRNMLNDNWDGFVPEFILSLLYGLAYAIPFAFLINDQNQFIALIIVLLLLLVLVALWLWFKYDSIRQTSK